MTSVPRFRTARRLVQWVERNWTLLEQDDLGRRRVPREIEGVFFRTKKETPPEVADCVARYARWAGRLHDFESLLRCNTEAVFVYLRAVRNMGEEVPPEVVSWLAGDSRNLYRWASQVGSRLPAELEDTIGDPRYAFMYSKEVLRGRLPSHLEDSFYGSPYYAAKYAFEVIRGFAPCRLPDTLHNMMVMKSFEDPDDDNIKTYLRAAESDPNKVGNAEESVS